MAVFLLTFVGIHSVKAQTLVLHHADGTTTDVQLLTQPRVTFENDKLLITSTVLNMEYPKEDILRFTYKGKTTTGIAIPKAETEYSRVGDQLVFRNISTDAQIPIYTVSGIRVPVTISRSANTATLPLSALPSGTFLLSINGKTSKFTRP